jgi:hypothetical protein
MHASDGAPRLPRAVRTNDGLVMLLLLAAAAGAMLAFGDVLQEGRKKVTDA